MRIDSTEGEFLNFPHSSLFDLHPFSCQTRKSPISFLHGPNLGPATLHCAGARAQAVQRSSQSRSHGCSSRQSGTEGHHQRRDGEKPGSRRPTEDPVLGQRGESEAEISQGDARNATRPRMRNSPIIHGNCNISYPFLFLLKLLEGLVYTISAFSSNFSITGPALLLKKP